MKSAKNPFAILLALLISLLVNNFSFAQTAPVKKNVPAPTPTTKEQVAEVKDGLCGCLKGAIDAIQKSYVSLEEDEWPAAIKITKDTITIINTLSKTCACPETVAYQKVSEAYLKYAEGGNHLDGAEEPDCPFATMLYSDAITLLDTYIPKISNATVKANAEDIKGYVKEEKEFVDEECGGTKSQGTSTSSGEAKTQEKSKTTGGKVKTQEKPKGTSGETKQEKKK